jgi:hypothetical protein
MYFQVYLRNDLVYLPTLGKMGPGFYRGVEPVAVISVKDTEGIRSGLDAIIARGNPDVPVPKRRDWPPPVLLKYAGLTWSAFEAGMSFWGMEQKRGVWRIIGKRKRPDGTMGDDSAQTITFSPETAVDEVIDKMIAILQDATHN